MNKINKAIGLSREFKYVMTFGLYICYFIYAMNFCITGPTLLDLKKIYHVSFLEISNMNTVRSIAYIFGALNGFAFQYMNRELLFMFLLIIVSITMALTPLLPSLSMLYLNCAINGFASAGIESVSDVWILEMWKQECGPFVQALHFTFGIGSIATTLIVQPFLSENIIENIEKNNTNEFLKDSLNETSSQLIPQLISDKTIGEIEVFHSDIYIPYIFGAMAIASNVFIFGAFYIYKTYYLHYEYTEIPQEVMQKDIPLLTQLKNLLKTRLMPTKLTFLLIVLSSSLMSTSGILECGQLTYFPSFAHFSNPNISVKRAARMLTDLTIAFTVGRAIAIPLSHYLKPMQMIFGSLTLLSFANYLFLYYANHSETFMWFANINYGLGVSSLLASVYAMLEEQISVNNLIGALFTFMSGLTGTVYPVLLGYYIESQPLVLVYFNIFITTLSFLLLISIHIIILKHFR